LALLHIYVNVALYNLSRMILFLFFVCSPQVSDYVRAIEASKKEAAAFADAVESLTVEHQSSEAAARDDLQDTRVWRCTVGVHIYVHAWREGTTRENCFSCLRISTSISFLLCLISIPL